MAAPHPEQPSITPPDIDEDPYQVYMLRRPAERASSVIPQLPKQPEMADTRLRYRRIAPEARSGSLGSLGNHFPARFQFPPRRSLLESLTSDDDEPNSFAIRKRNHKSKKKKKKKKKSRHPSSSMDSNASDLVAPIALAAPDEHVSDDSTPISTSPTTPVPSSPSHHVNGLVLSDDHDEHVDANLDPYEIELRGASQTVETASTPTHEPPREHIASEHTASVDRGKSHVALTEEKDEACVTRSSSAHRASTPDRSCAVTRTHSHPRLSEAAPEEKKAGRGKARKEEEEEEEEEEAHGIVPDAGAMRFVDGRRIAAPAAMSAEMKAHFVLKVEQPLMYVRRGREGERRVRKGKKKGKRNQVDGEMGAEVSRDREVSVSFAHRRMTAEEAASKPLNALQRLLQAIAFVKMTGLKVGKTR